MLVIPAVPVTPIPPVLAESISPAVPIIFFGAIGLGVIAMLFVTVAIAISLAAVVIEPTTAKAAFGD